MFDERERSVTLSPPTPFAIFKAHRSLLLFSLGFRENIHAKETAQTFLCHAIGGFRIEIRLALSAIPAGVLTPPVYSDLLSAPDGRAPSGTGRLVAK
jgi:hypothetical protein